MAKPNYQFEKRRRDMEKKAKKAEKKQRKLEKGDAPDDEKTEESTTEAQPE